jgi:hypothetical protein
MVKVEGPVVVPFSDTSIKPKPVYVAPKIV